MTIMREPKRLPIALLTCVGWALLTLFGMRWAGNGSKELLIETVTHGISWILTMAVGLLALVTLAMRTRSRVPRNSGPRSRLTSQSASPRPLSRHSVQ